MSSEEWTAAEAEFGESVGLDYDVIDVSSTTNGFTADNIKLNAPSDLNSRWQSETNQPSQYLLLRLRHVALVRTITFGKYDKQHVAQLRRFNVYGGLKPDNLVKICTGNCQNDPTPETFSLRSTVVGKPNIPFPCRYVKIEPLQAWGSNYNFSIWHVRLQGDNRTGAVSDAMRSFTTHRNTLARKMCIQFLRECGHERLSEQLAEESDVLLEHPLITRLYETLLAGNFQAAEETIDKAAAMRMFDAYVSAQTYELEWTELPAEEPIPGKRGGHQMVYDSVNDCLYLFGGWNGHQDLADLWSYNLAEARWNCLSQNVQLEGGPCARSCHRLVFDPPTQQIFCLGRFLENVGRTDSLVSDFYAYHVPTNTWTLVTVDTTASGGPSLTYDHQMVLDETDRTIYVFGGRILAPPPSINVSQLLASRGEPPTDSARYSGLYSYHIPTRTWTKLRDDTEEAEVGASQVHIRGRCAHSMLFDKSSRCIYMFAGQRNKELLTDMLKYSVDSDTLATVADANGIPVKVPEIGNTQRATINDTTGEIYVLSGIIRSQSIKPNVLSARLAAMSEGVSTVFKAPPPESLMRTSFWVFSLSDYGWTQAAASPSAAAAVAAVDSSALDAAGPAVAGPSTAPGSSAGGFSRADLLRAINDRRIQIKLKSRFGGGGGAQPCPRYAHQLIYDTSRKIHYLFGGNPGCPPERLNDFWKLELSKCSVDELVADCRWQIREAAFECLLAAGDPMRALHHLQHTLAPLATKCNAHQQLNALTMRIFDPDLGGGGGGGSRDSSTAAESSSRDDDHPGTDASSSEDQVADSAGPTTAGPDRSQPDRTAGISRALALAVFHSCVRYFPPDSRPPDRCLTDLIEF